MTQSLNKQDEARARDLYKEFQSSNPDQRNPSDINTVEKANFLILKGFLDIHLMQTARKQAYDFTKSDN